MHRELCTELGGEKFITTVRTGFPQGGVCSAKFWIIAFNRAVEIINTRLATGFAFADDLCALPGSNSINFITTRLQRIIDELTIWGSTCGLKFSSEKTVAILFSKSKKITAQS